METVRFSDIYSNNPAGDMMTQRDERQRADT